MKRRTDGKTRVQKTVYADAQIINEIRERGLESEFNYSAIFEEALRSKLDNIEGDDLALKLQREIKEKERKIEELQEKKKEIQQRAKNEFGMNLEDYIKQKKPVSKKKEKMDNFIDMIPDQWKDKIPANGEEIIFSKPGIFGGGKFKGDLQDYARFIATKIFDEKIKDEFGYVGIQAEHFCRDAFKRYRKQE